MLNITSVFQVLEFAFHPRFCLHHKKRQTVSDVHYSSCSRSFIITPGFNFTLHLRSISFYHYIPLLSDCGVFFTLPYSVMTVWEHEKQPHILQCHAMWSRGLSWLELGLGCIRLCLEKLPFPSALCMK